MQGNIVLIGFMGTGKSTIGRELSKMLSYPLIDTDHAIAKKAGKSIPKILRRLGYVVWLAASPEEILDRTSRNNNRPLLNNEDPSGTILRLLAERNPLYSEASHLNIETDQLCFDEICNGIIESARYHYGTK